MFLELYDLEFEKLVDYLNSKNEIDRKKILKDENIKRKLICSNIEDFSIISKNENLMLELLDSSGIEMLKDDYMLDEKLRYILRSKCEYVDVLFKNKDFDKLFWDFVDNNHYDILFLLDDEVPVIELLNYINQDGKDRNEKTRFLSHANPNIMSNLIKEKKLDLDSISVLLDCGGLSIIEEILSHDDRVVLSECSFHQLYKILSSVKIPKILFDDDLVSRIVSITNVNDYRFLIEKAKFLNDVFVIEDSRKKFYEEEFKNYNKELDMLGEYAKIYEEFKEKIKSVYSKDVSSLVDTIYNSFNFYESKSQESTYRNALFDVCSKNDVEGFMKFLQRESSIKTTDMIVDYHFEDVYYNFCLDLEQLLHFQEAGVKILDDNSIEKYKKILNLDNLSMSEKMDFHRELLKENQKDAFYDDFRKTKDECYKMINDSILNRRNLQKYKNEELSLKYGVPIYFVSDDPFLALVKSLKVSKDSILTEDDMRSFNDAGSFSIDSNSICQTFSTTSYNIIYEEFPIDQMVHIFPADSYSSYKREVGVGNSFVNYLFTPQELSTYVSGYARYNELVIAQRNESRKNNDLNDSLKEVKKFGIYCYDKFTENDVLSAKKLGIGIVVVDAKNYSLKYTNSLKRVDVNRYFDGYMSLNDDMHSKRR